MIGWWGDRREFKAISPFVVYSFDVDMLVMEAAISL